MGYTTFTSLGVKELLLGIKNLVCDGYLLLPSSLFASLLLFSIPAAAGHMGLDVLNGVGLALVGDYLIGLTFPMVAATMYQAYISRSIQSGNWESVRLTFQRTALIWLALFLIIHVPILCNWELILLVAKQDSKLAHLAQIFIFIQLPRYFATYISYICLMTLFAQDAVWPTFLANLLNFVLVVIAEILVNIYHGGVYLLAIGVCVSQLLTTAFVIVIFIVKEAQCDHLNLLIFDTSNLFEWSEMFCQTILSIVQHIGTRCIMEVGVIIGGMLSPVELGAATILRRYTAFVSSIPLNLMAPVVCKSISSSIGKRSHVSVKVYIFSALLFVFSIGVLLTLINVLFREQIAALMTSMPSVVAVTASLTIIVSFMDWIALVYMTNIFIFRGLGAMTFPTIISFSFQYCFALPLSIFLVFTANMHLTGYYLALCISFLLEIFVDNGYLHLYNLPALIERMQSTEVEQQPLNAKRSLATFEAEFPQPPQTWSWVTRCCLLIFLALFVNSIALGIHFSTNYFLD